MRYLNLKLKNSKIMMLHFEPNSSDPLVHDHGDEFQITIPISGAPILDMNHQSNRLHQQTRMITLPGEEHFHYTGDSESKILLINFKKKFLDHVISSRLDQSPIGADFSIYSEGSSEKLIKIANELVSSSLFQPDASFKIEELEWELAETFLSIQEGSHSEQWKREVILRQHPIIKNLMDFMHENYQNELSLDELSIESKLSKFYLLKAFKDIVGCTPSQYLLKIRMEKAIELLLYSQLDITTICFEAGFGSLTTFERVFKKRFGCSVSQYRIENKL